MSLALVVLTKDGGERLGRLLKWARSKPFLSALYIFVDEATTDGSEAVSRASGAITERITVPNIDSALAYCHSPERIKADWALHLGDDELMGQWFDQDIERLMRAPYDVYSLPRYNVVLPDVEITGATKTDILVSVKPNGLPYISSKPWYPDFCQRLFRPGYLIHNGEVHEGAQANGRLAMARPHVFHFDFIDQTLAERQAKWLRYVKQGVEAVSKKRGLPVDYYRRWAIPEDYPHEVAICEEQL